MTFLPFAMQFKPANAGVSRFFQFYNCNAIYIVVLVDI
jgi:hypothetical protein